MNKTNASVQEVFANWKRYKYEVPVFGAIMLDESLDNVCTVHLSNLVCYLFFIFYVYTYLYILMQDKLWPYYKFPSWTKWEKGSDSPVFALKETCGKSRLNVFNRCLILYFSLIFKEL